jgi:hypothetical protein
MVISVDALYSQQVSVNGARDFESRSPAHWASLAVLWAPDLSVCIQDDLGGPAARCIYNRCRLMVRGDIVSRCPALLGVSMARRLRASFILLSKSALTITLIAYMSCYFSLRLIGLTSTACRDV